jgi:hypothetical protein
VRTCATWSAWGTLRFHVRSGEPAVGCVADDSELRQVAGTGAAGNQDDEEPVESDVLDVIAYQDARRSGLIPRLPPAQDRGRVAVTRLRLPRTIINGHVCIA